MPRATRKSRTAALAFDALSVEGALIAPAMLARIAEQKPGGQAESDYNIPKGLTLRDEIARYFRIGQALFTELCASAALSAAATTRFVQALLRDVFGFGDISPVGTRTLDERLHVVTLEARGGRVPVVVVPPSDDLDAPSAASAERGSPALGRFGRAGLAQRQRGRDLGIVQQRHPASPRARQCQPDAACLHPGGFAPHLRRARHSPTSPPCGC